MAASVTTLFLITSMAKVSKVSRTGRALVAQAPFRRSRLLWTQPRRTTATPRQSTPACKVIVAEHCQRSHMLRRARAFRQIFSPKSGEVGNLSRRTLVRSQRLAQFDLSTLFSRPLGHPGRGARRDNPVWINRPLY